MMRPALFFGVAIGLLVTFLAMPEHLQARNPRGALSGSLLAACSGPGGSSGGITVTASIVTDATTASPAAVWLDATATTDSNALGFANNVYQDLTAVWNFGDGGASGTGNWSYGTKVAKSLGTGLIQGHLYQASTDTLFTPSVTVSDGLGNSVTCSPGSVTVKAATTQWPGTATTCAYNVTLGSGCPSGAGSLQTTSFATAISTKGGSGKQVLFQCGDTFSGEASVGGTTVAIGAFGSCPGTQTNRPIFHDSGTAGMLTVAGAASDIRISDIDFEGGGTSAYAVYEPGGQTPVQGITLANLNSNGNTESFYWSSGHNMALVGSVQASAGDIGTYPNFGECNSGSNLDYLLMVGNSFTGQDGTGSSTGVETVRISCQRLGVIQSNTFQDANNIGANLKIHAGNTYLSCQVSGNCAPCTTGLDSTTGSWFLDANCWVARNTNGTGGGWYTELLELSDNYFSGRSGAQYLELAPQNAHAEEHLRNIIVERNLFEPGVTADMVISAVNVTYRDNVSYVTVTPSGYAVQAGQRGIEPVPTGLEFFNNTHYTTQTASSQACWGFDGGSGYGTGNAAINSFAMNNLCFLPASKTVVVNNGTGNTISNNTATTTLNPAFTDPSGSFVNIADFKPTANYSGATTAPVQADALGIAWSPTWNLGAVKH